MAPRTRHGQKGGQALPNQSQEAQPITAPPEPHLSPAPAPPPQEPPPSPAPPPPAPPPPPKPSEDPEVASLIQDQIERFKREPNYEHHVNNYVPKIKSSFKYHIIKEAGRRAAMDLETPKGVADRIDPQDVMLDVTHPLMQGYYGCDELLSINWTDFESTETGPHTF